MPRISPPARSAAPMSLWVGAPAAGQIARGRADYFTTPKGGSLEFPVADSRFAEVLGGAGLYHSPALRCRSGRRHLSPRDRFARARTRALECCLCPALASADRRPLR